MKPEPTNVTDRSARASIPFAEWIVAAVGCSLVIASFGFLAYRAVNEREPPSFEFVVEAVNADPQSNSVTVSVRNRGGTPVADLRVRAITDASESREVTIDYVPAKSSRNVTFVFTDTTTTDQVSFIVESFMEP